MINPLFVQTVIGDSGMPGAAKTVAVEEAEAPSPGLVDAPHLLQKRESSAISASHLEHFIWVTFYP